MLSTRVPKKKVRCVTLDCGISTSGLGHGVNRSDWVKSCEITRTGDNSKFFGFGYIQRANVKLVNIDTILTADDKKTLMKAGNKVDIDPWLNEYPKTYSTVYHLFPTFYITEIHIDEKTHEYSITAYDILHDIDKRLVSELELTAPYTLGDVVDAIAEKLNIKAVHEEDEFNLNFENGANLEGTENFKEILDAIAEATQTIYYISNGNRLTFKRLDYNGDAVLNIDKNDYFELSSKTNRRLQTIASVTELGDNYSASTTQSGTTQYVRNNPFWELRDDIATLVDNALKVAGNATINQFEMDWRGNPTLEIGDKICIETPNGEKLYSYLLDDTFTYDGALKQKTQWNFEDNDNETDTNPTNLGDALKQTYAKVDKANKQIDLTVSDVSSLKNEVSGLQQTSNSISASVKRIQDNTDNSISSLNDDINQLINKVEAAVTAEDVSIRVSEAIQNAEVDKVTTTTGFTFDSNGLTISKTGSEMDTTVDENGMTIRRNNTEVLVANNEGVTAYNLDANTYLIIGKNSRFEDYDNDSKTGCFWLGY